MTIAQAKAILNPLGIVLVKADDEFRVNVRGRSEASAYYTNDLADAVDTGKAMAARVPEQYTATAACGSGWTNDRCTKRFGHRGAHSNE